MPARCVVVERVHVLLDEGQCMNETILVVEGEVALARELQRTLHALGYQVPAIAHTADEAVHVAAQHPPVLVLLDAGLRRDAASARAVDALHAQHGASLVYLTTGAEGALAGDAARRAHGHVRRPASAEDLRLAIELALQRRALERALHDRERWFAATLRSIADAVIAVDAGGRVTWLNAAAEALTGWAAADAIGRALDDVFQLVDPDSGRPRPLGRAHAVAHTEATLRARDGGLRLISDALAPITDERGHAAGALLVFRDVGSARRLTQQLELTRRMTALGTLSAGLGHEINNPLAYIRTNVQFVRELFAAHRPSGERWLDDADEALADVDLGTEEIRRVVAELRVFAKSPEPTHGPLDIHEAVRWALDAAGAQVRARARLDVELGATPAVEGDVGRLGQVLVHLLTNAAQAIEHGEPADNVIAARTWTEPDGWAAIEISDTGRGIAHDRLARIFDPFHNARRGGRGNGMGLAVSKGLVSALGGTIEVTSQVGAGSRFRVRLPPSATAAATTPAAPARSTPRGAARAPHPAGAQLTRVLVIDDDPMVRTAIGRLLAGRYDVVMAEHARGALDRLDVGERFPIILCDLSMPGMSGIELHRELAARYPDQARRMLFITGGALSADAAAFVDQAPLGHIGKPFDRAELIVRLDAALDHLGPPAP